MSQRVFLRAGVAALVSVLFIAGTASGAESEALRTAWDAPDIGGIWDFRTITPMQRPESLGEKAFLTEEEAAEAEKKVIDRNESLATREARRTSAGGNVDVGEEGAPGFYNNFWLDTGTKTVATRRTSLIIDPPNGRMPAMTENAQSRTSARREFLREHPADSWTDRSAYDRCILGFNAGPPITPLGYNQNLQIFQTRSAVVLVTEMVHTTRVVPIDGRPEIDSDIRQWSGDSRGWWDGDTLVVETANFRADRGWRGSTENMKLVERFTRIDVETLDYTFTVDDPNTWTSTWTASIPMRRTDVPMFEYACHEGNYAMPNILAGERARERAAAAGH
ncbi:MAG: hypothetical protein VYE73_09385 [Acidobacteriota bacterium]|nr:hypothetical protein [Acidobacteriota bacterium]